MKTFKNLSTTIRIHDDNSNVNSTLPIASSKHSMHVFIRIEIKGREREKKIINSNIKAELNRTPSYSKM